MTATPWRFGLKFLVVFAVLTGAFEASRGTSFERFIVEDVILLPTAAVISRAFSGDPVAVQGRTLVSRAARLRITRGCEGIEMFLLLAAAMVAFPATWKRRLQGLLLGSVLAYVLTVLRLAALDSTLRFAPQAWEALHGLVLPLAPVIIMAFYFLRWSALGVAETRVGRQSHAA